MNEFWQVALTTAPFAQLTYARPDWFPELSPGLRVLVPMRGSLRVGVLTEPCTEPPQGVAIKDMAWPLDTAPLLDAQAMDMARTLAGRQLKGLGEVLALLLPAGLKSSQVTFEVDAPGFGRRLKPKDIARMEPERRGELYTHLLAGKVRLLRRAQVEGEEPHLYLEKDPPWPVRPNAKRQIELLEHLLEEGPQPVDRVRRRFGPGTPEVERRLEGAGLVRHGGPPDLNGQGQGVDPACADDAVEPSPAEMTPTPEQALALEQLLPLLESGKPEAALLHGVTGSGKTLVYLELAARCLELGRNVLLLAPEVALACRLASAVRKRFPEAKVLLHHGYQSPSRREAAFLDLAARSSTEPCIVVGTRSALFLPLANPGLIVVDEEHDESFKQEERLSYQAKELAWYRAELSGGLILLGSATPDLKSYHAADSGQVRLVTMADRVGSAVLPEVELVDASQTRPDQPLAPAALEALQAVVEQGEQAIILLNRRGYSHLMYCLDCGQVVRCAECAVAMTFHKARQRLVCHYCGHSLPWPLVCPGCGGTNFLPLGQGTERLEEHLRKVLPREAGVLRLDRDSTRRQERLEEILDRFERGEAQVLVGTQMLSKGHHFPQVTLALVVDGDLGLNLPDYRAAERTFQLLVQVSGRSGRGERPGRVLIQTRNPGHPFWENVRSADYQAFYAKEIQTRERFCYPPFTRLGLIRFSHPLDYDDGAGLLAQAGQLLRTRAGECGARVLGPVPAPLGLLRGRKRFNCMVKATGWAEVRGLFAALRHWNPDPANLRLALDLDPVSML